MLATLPDFLKSPDLKGLIQLQLWKIKAGTSLVTGQWEGEICACAHLHSAFPLARTLDLPHVSYHRPIEGLSQHATGLLVHMQPLRSSRLSQVDS